MAKRVLDVKAGDNKYLHRDFHMSGDIGVAYVGEKYGDAGVRDYLRTFAQAHYAPLARDFAAQGLIALERQIRSTYEAEEMPEVCHTSINGDELLVAIDRCPAISYFRSVGHTPSRWYIELTRTVNEAIAEMCGIGFELLSYDEATGAAKYRYFRGCE